MVRKVPFFALCLFSAFSFSSVSAGASSQALDYFREGYAACMAREWDKAVALYTSSIELDPDNAEVYFQRAVARDMAGRTDDAIADYLKALQLKPGYYLAMEYLAKLYESKGRYAEAIDLYTRALPLVTDSKWRSMVQWWISEAKRNIAAPRKIERR